MTDAKPLSRTRESGSRDSGFTLVELVIASSLLGIVLLIVGGMLISSLQAESTVRSLVQATSQGQLAARSIQTGVRNSSGFTIKAVPNNGQLLVARVAGTAAVLTWHCEAWFYSPSDGTIRWHKYADGATVAVTAGSTSWTLLVDGVKPPQGSPAIAPIFTGSNTNPLLTLAFEVDAGDDPNAAISSSALRRLDEPSTQCS